MTNSFDNYHPSRESVPNHIGIIPDGSRRWARINGTTYFESYNYAMIKLVRIIDYLYSEGVKELSLYFSSTLNFERPKKEIDDFCRAESLFCSDYVQTVIQNYNVSVDYYGNVDLLPGFFQDSLAAIKTKTINHIGRQLNLCVAYNPFDELLEAVNRSDSPANLLSNLWIKTPVDMIIRTGQVMLLSNFLILQSGFARLFFPDKLINDLDLEDVKMMIADFKQFERKYGE